MKKNNVKMKIRYIVILLILFIINQGFAAPCGDVILLIKWFVQYDDFHL
jgi:hypothetical protein